jgi:glycosyltransferase involved in cell wall biosynthesis
MKIVHLSTGLNPGGAERQLRNLVTATNPQRFRHVIISMLDRGLVGDQLAADGFEVHALEMESGIPSPFAFPKLAKLLREIQPDILQCWMYHANLLGLLAGKLVGVPAIIWGIRTSNPQYQSPRSLTGLVVKVCSWFSSHLNCVIVNSKNGRARHRRWGYCDAKLRVIPNGFDVSEFKPDPEARRAVRAELGVGESEILIGMIARFLEVKDHATFFAAARILRQREARGRFLLAGQGIDRSNEALWRMLVAAGMEDRVYLLGRRSDVARVTAALDIATLTSWGESFPNVIGEAMACGVPCAATDSGDTAEIIADAGRVVPIRDPEALARTWEELIRIGPAGRRALGERARVRVVENYSIKKLAETYESLYEEIWLHKDRGREAPSQEEHDVSVTAR